MAKRGNIKSNKSHFCSIEFTTYPKVRVPMFKRVVSYCNPSRLGLRVPSQKVFRFGFSVIGTVWKGVGICQHIF